MIVGSTATPIRRRSSSSPGRRPRPTTLACTRWPFACARSADERQLRPAQHGPVGAPRRGQRRAVAVRPRRCQRPAAIARWSTKRSTASAAPRASTIACSISPAPSPPRRATSDADLMAAQILWTILVRRRCGAVVAVAAASMLARDAELRDANRRQACDAVATTLAERSDSMLFALIGARIGQRRRLARGARRRRPRPVAGARRQLVRRPRSAGPARRTAALAFAPSSRAPAGWPRSASRRSRATGSRPAATSSNRSRASSETEAAARVALRRGAAGDAAASLRARRRPAPRQLAGIAQARREPVDRHVDAALHALDAGVVLAARAVAPHQLDLQVVERIEVRKAVLDRARQRRVRRQPAASRR